MNDYNTELKLHIFKKRLSKHYLSFSCTPCHEQLTIHRLNQIGVTVKSIIGHTDSDVTGILPLWDKPNVAWLAFDDQLNLDLWYFHKDNTEAALFFRLIHPESKLL